MPLENRDQSIITYTSSQRGRNKKSLPDWQGLSRKDKAEFRPPEYFASGRLHNLFCMMERETPALLLEKEKELAADSIDKNEMRKKAALPKASQDFLCLIEKLNREEVKNSKDQRNSLNSDIESLLNEAINPQEEKLTHSEASDLLKICKDTTRSAFLDLANSKKNKPKLAERKTLLKKFADIYNLEHS